MPSPDITILGSAGSCRPIQRAFSQLMLPTRKAGINTPTWRMIQRTLLIHSEWISIVIGVKTGTFIVLNLLVEEGEVVLIL
jgi:hypothetical protein